MKIVAAQWEAATRILLGVLEALQKERWTSVRYDALLADPQAEIERRCSVADFEWDRVLDAPLPLSRYTVSEPDPQKVAAPCAPAGAVAVPHRRDRRTSRRASA
jgi:hypothetical protein